MVANLRHDQTEDNTNSSAQEILVHDETSVKSFVGFGSNVDDCGANGNAEEDTDDRSESVTHDGCPYSLTTRETA
ncbi:hypothetical protein D3C78_1445470 [compost metagenome]